MHGADQLWHAQAGDPQLQRPSTTPAARGVVQTQYSLDGEPWTSGTSAHRRRPGDHAGDGVHTVRYRSIDYAGNVEPAQSCEVRIDTTPPATTVSGSDRSLVRPGRHASPSTASDTGSGRRLHRGRLDGGPWTKATTITDPRTRRPLRRRQPHDLLPLDRRGRQRRADPDVHRDDRHLGAAPRGQLGGDGHARQDGEPALLHRRPASRLAHGDRHDQGPHAHRSASCASSWSGTCPSTSTSRDLHLPPGARSATASSSMPRDAAGNRQSVVASNTLQVS